LLDQLLDYLIDPELDRRWQFDANSLGLTAKSNLVGCSTGISAGFVPLSILAA
jgi:hypothetical protein